MTAFPGQRRWIVPAFLLAVAAVSAGVWRYGYLQALDQLARRGDADLALASDRLSTQLQVYRELAVLMADHPSKVATAVEVAKKTRKIVWQNIIFALGVKLLFIILGVAGVATMWEAVFGDMGVALAAIFNAMRVKN